MGMYHSSSGKNGFEPYYHDSNLVIPKEVLISILKREDQLRASPFYQIEYAKKDSLRWIRDVTKRIQKQALEEHGIVNGDGLSYLNSARFKYKNDPEVNRLTVYMREDRSRAGELQLLEKAPDASLRRLDGSSTSLYEYISLFACNRPVILFSGSVT